MDASNSDEYFVTALQIFDYCGAESSGALRVDALMDKFAPFVKTNKSEYTYLRSLLDPDHENPEISVAMLAKALNKYSERQKAKVDLDESFNLKSGQAPQDSDSGISTDGFQLVEELQCELKEKERLAHQLRSQLDFTDRQHEEAFAALTGERDSLLAHVNMLREENAGLCDLRRDYEDACERLVASEQALTDSRRELDGHKKRVRLMGEQVAVMEAEKLTLQELLTKSKDECHRINEMYASRQSSLLEENDTLKTEHADLSARLQDQEEFMQQMIKEKVLLEMELKDLLNKSNQTQLRMDRSIDISYTEDQMLTALDSLNADSRFSQDNRILDEESFVFALKEEQGRVTNLSLFDELRLSIANVSRHNDAMVTCDRCKENLDVSLPTISTQIDDGFVDNNSNNNSSKDQCDCDEKLVAVCTGTQTESKHKMLDKYNNVAIQTDFKCEIKLKVTDCQNEEKVKYNNVSTRVNNVREIKLKCSESQTEKTTKYSNIATQTNIVRKIKSKCSESQTEKTAKYNNIATQTDIEGKVELNCTESQTEENNNICMECYKCQECDNRKRHAEKLESDLRLSQQTIYVLKNELEEYDNNLNILQKVIDNGNNKNCLLEAAVNSLKNKLCILEAACEKQRDKINSLTCDTCCALSQTEFDTATVGIQADVACTECVKRNAVVPRKNFRKYLWEPLKCLFQIFAVLCFVCAISLLYGVSRRWQANCNREAVPWRWLDAQDLMDLLLRIEYVADVPM